MLRDFVDMSASVDLWPRKRVESRKIWQAQVQVQTQLSPGDKENIIKDTFIETEWKWVVQLVIDPEWFPEVLV